MTATSAARLQALESAPLDAWIGLSEDESRLVAVGSDYRDVSEKADAAGEPNVVILKTPSVWAPFSKFFCGLVGPII
jgi:hypothetical protein